MFVYRIAAQQRQFSGQRIMNDVHWRALALATGLSRRGASSRLQNVNLRLNECARAPCKMRFPIKLQPRSRHERRNDDVVDSLRTKSNAGCQLLLAAVYKVSDCIRKSLSATCLLCTVVPCRSRLIPSTERRDAQYSGLHTVRICTLYCKM